MPPSSLAPSPGPPPELGPQTEDLTGMRFGSWLVEGLDSYTKKRAPLWRCKCDCGYVAAVRGAALKNGTTSKCQECTHRKLVHDYTGMTFGKWLVLEVRRGEGYGVRWLCRCECGREQVVSAQSLRSGDSTQCWPCRTKSVTKPLETPIRSVLSTYVSRAKKHGREFTITNERAFELFLSPCHYCGAPPSNVMKVRSECPDLLYSGIDRIDSSLGYVEGNVVSACEICNKSKSDLEKSDFIEWIYRAHAHQESLKVAYAGN